MIARFAIAAAATVFAIVAAQSANAQSTHGVAPSHTSETTRAQPVPSEAAHIPPVPAVPGASMIMPPVMAPAGLPARLVPALSTPSSTPAIQLIRR